MVLKFTWSMLFEKKLLFLDSVGFSSLNDFLGNVFVNKWLLVISATIGAIFGVVDHFIELHIFDPSKGIWILVGATSLDVMLGISVGVKEKLFDPYRLNRAWIRMITQISFIYLINQISMVWDMVNDWMVSTLLLAFVLATFWSAFRNAYKLRWIQPTTYEMIEKIISVQDVFQGVVKKMFKPDNPKKDEE